MEKPKMSIEEVKSYITLVTDFWENEKTTNCYAFALDLPEENISKNAYQVGVLGAIRFGFNYVDLRMMSYDERLRLDLAALNIAVKEVSPDTETIIKPLYTDSKFKYIDCRWPIALFESDDNVHFLRKGRDGVWYHKYGYDSPVIDCDCAKRIITSPEECDLGRYKYKKTYLLKYTKED